MYDIYILGFTGLCSTGIVAHSENEANHICNQYNDDEDYNPHCQYVYMRA